MRHSASMSKYTVSHNYTLRAYQENSHTKQNIADSKDYRINVD